MAYKDTLAMYDELIAGGCTEAQARVQATQLGAVSDTLESKLGDQSSAFDIKFDHLEKSISELRTEMREGFHSIEKDISSINANIKWINVAGAAIITSLTYLYLHSTQLL